MNFEDKTILVTGGAGFIGHHIVNYFLSEQPVKKIKVVDDLSNGVAARLDKFSSHSNVEIILGDLADLSIAENACKDADLVCHQAALGSVPRSIADPLNSIRANVNGFANVLQASRANKVERIVYASSSSVYGDIADAVKTEARTGKVLSPYAATKVTNEVFAHAFAAVSGFSAVGLRYFNVFGPGQSPVGPYAAVIPKFVKAVLNGHAPTIFGDGSASRDFTPIINVVRANILALSAPLGEKHTVFNIACGGSLTVNELWDMVRTEMNTDIQPIYSDPRIGDIAHSLADISKARELLGYEPDRNYRNWIAKAINYISSVDY